MLTVVAPEFFEEGIERDKLVGGKKSQIHQKWLIFRFFLFDLTEPQIPPAPSQVTTEC